MFFDFFFASEVHLGQKTTTLFPTMHSRGIFTFVPNGSYEVSDLMLTEMTTPSVREAEQEDSG